MNDATPRIRTLIVDDEPLARDNMRILLDGDDEVEVVGECADGAAAVQMIRTNHVDLVLLDVQMPGKSGFDVIRDVGTDCMPVVIFATAYDTHAIEAFEAHALDYLLKPFDDQRFAEAVGRAKHQIRTRAAAELGKQVSAMLRGSIGRGQPERIRLKTPGRVVLLTPDEVDFVEAADYCVRVHAGASVHLVRESMNTMERDLGTERFVRIHRSTIVNVDRIREVQPLEHGDWVVLLKDGSQHRLSRSRRRDLEARLGPLG